MDNVQLLDFFKVMSNEYRLQLAALLMEKEFTMRELADTLTLKQAEVIEHLAMLREMGLVRANSHDHQTFYAFDKKALYKLNRDVMKSDPLPTPVDNHPDELERKMMKNWFEGDQLVTIPAQPKRFQVLINWLVTLFEPEVRYTEKQVNEIIKRHNPDSATLRRAMIDAGLMQREHGIYWRVS